MNKRQHKKYLKKFKRKSYIDVRRETIVTSCYKKYPNIKQSPRNIIYIKDSKKMNFKHPIKIMLLENCYPVSYSFSVNVHK